VNKIATALPPTHERLLLLDGLRGIAAIAVILCHFSALTAQPIVANAGFAVDLFFCLSGYVLAETYGGRLVGSLSASEFMIRRLIRLYPLYLAGIMIGFLALSLKLATGAIGDSFGRLLADLEYNLVFLPALNATNGTVFGDAQQKALFPSNIPAWSLFFELAVNLFYARAARSKLIVFVAIAAASLPLYILAIAWFHTTPGWGSENFLGGFPRVLYGFFAGVALQRFLYLWRTTDKSAVSRRGSAWGTAAGVALLATVGALLAAPTAVAYLIALLLAPGIVCVAAQVRLGPRLNAFCAGLGWLSYPLYCLHCPTYMLVGAVVGAIGFHPTPVALAVIAAPVTLAAAIGLTRWWDEPARRFLAHRLEIVLATQAATPVADMSRLPLEEAA
jgi:peptidoglycan/LPS O-acetylase OafA/YrhL